MDNADIAAKMTEALGKAGGTDKSVSKASLAICNLVIYQFIKGVDFLIDPLFCADIKKTNGRIKSDI